MIIKLKPELGAGAGAKAVHAKGSGHCCVSNGVDWFPSGNRLKKENLEFSRVSHKSGSI